MEMFLFSISSLVPSGGEVAFYVVVYSVIILLAFVIACWKDIFYFLTHGKIKKETIKKQSGTGDVVFHPWDDEDAGETLQQEHADEPTIVFGYKMPECSKFVSAVLTEKETSQIKAMSKDEVMQWIEENKSVLLCRANECCRYLEYNDEADEGKFFFSQNVDFYTFDDETSNLCSGEYTREEDVEKPKGCRIYFLSRISDVVCVAESSVETERQYNVGRYGDGDVDEDEWEEKPSIAPNDYSFAPQFMPVELLSTDHAVAVTDMYLRGDYQDVEPTCKKETDCGCVILDFAAEGDGKVLYSSIADLK